MNKIDRITKDVIVDARQGYAFYYKDREEEVIKFNGYQNDSDSALINGDTHFRLASVTKQFIACGIIRLIEEKRLDFDTCVLDVFPKLPKYFKNIKIINLLNHTSGIYDYEDMPHEDDAKQIVDEEIIDFLLTTDGTYFEVGSKYQYSNTAYCLLGLILKEVSHLSLGEFLRKKVFEEAAMFDTLANYQGITIIERRALGHVLENDKLLMKDQYWCSATIGDGGIYSTLNDLKKWIKYLKNNIEFYKNNMFKKDQLTFSNDFYKNYYGQGMRIIQIGDKEIYYHCGETIGFNTIDIFSIDFDFECVFLTNMNIADPAILKDNIIDLIKNNIIK